MTARRGPRRIDIESGSPSPRSTCAASAYRQPLRASRSPSRMWCDGRIRVVRALGSMRQAAHPGGLDLRVAVEVSPALEDPEHGGGRTPIAEPVGSRPRRPCRLPCLPSAGAAWVRLPPDRRASWLRARRRARSFGVGDGDAGHLLAASAAVVQVGGTVVEVADEHPRGHRLRGEDRCARRRRPAARSTAGGWRAYCLRGFPAANRA